MVIVKATKLQERDIVAYAWFSLRRFHNIRYTAGLISTIHKVPLKFKRDVDKQAEQIRFFLLQAKEYFDAAKAVTLVTKPVLLYYSLMCLATAEVLFKQSGDSSIDKARANHRHHGLEFVNAQSKRGAQHILQAAADLRAKPAIRGNEERFGTFELWHRTAREAPMVADHTIHTQTGAIATYGVVASSQDSRLGYLSDEGITLLEALRYIPGMSRLLSRMGLMMRTLRTHVRKVTQGNQSFTLNITIHPNHKILVDEFLDNVKVNANDWDKIDYRELTDGGMILVTDISGDYQTRLHYPPCACEEYPNVMFWPTFQVLNEFGVLYVALYIAGNYARYYPDYWIHDVEETTELGLVIEELLNVAERRIGLLTLSELSQEYFVPA